MSNQRDLFMAVLEAEKAVAEASNKLAQAQTLFGQVKAKAEHQLALAWAAFEADMKEGGEYEVFIEDITHDYKIAYQKGREKVIIADESAVPDEFCKIERKPKLREIAEHLKTAQTNWAKFERSEPKLQWKIVKKGNHHDE